MKPIPILGIGLQSKSSNVTSQSRVNCYMDNSDDKNTVVAIGRPGLRSNINFGAGAKIRAMHIMASTGVLWIIVDDILYSAVEIAGTISSTYRGTIHYNHGFAEIDDNGLQIIITDNGQYIYTYTLATSTFAAMTDVDFPYSSTLDFPNYQSVVYLDSYIIANKPYTNQFQWSASYNATAWDALDIVSAESNPDNIVRIISQGGYAYVFGTDSTEFFNTDSTGLSVIKGLTISAGLAAIQSVAKVADGVICLTSIKNGVSQISLVTPGRITKVSTNDLDTIINAYYDISDATGFSYVMNGHEFYQINFTIGNQSWLYDLTMGLWTQLKSGSDRHYGQRGIKLNNHIYTDDYRNNGRVYYLDDTINNDNGTSINFELTSKHIFNGLEKVSIKEIQIDAETGMLADSGGTITPDMSLLVSKDNGKTFTTSVLSMGASGDYTKRIRKNRLGVARDWVFRLIITAAVKRVILGAYVELD